MRRKILIHAWDELEYKEESELRHSGRDVGKMTQMYRKLVRAPEDESKSPTRRAARRPSLLDTKSKGRQFKVQLNWLTAFMDKLGKKEFSQCILPKADLQSLLIQVSQLLDPLPNVIDLEIKKGNSLVVVGDLHGQIEDLLCILQTQGLPSAGKQFLFNGDFVDRGRYSCEVCIVIFALKVLFPKWVTMNRGNHEADDINSRDGFIDECVEKYDSDVYRMFNEVFCKVPLVHVLNKKVMVVHGGVCWEGGVTLKKINALDRKVLHPEYESVMEDLLWSDPGDKNHHGASANERGCGCVFGDDILCEFFEDNPPLVKLVRSHEKKEKGWESTFQDRCVTVFSASNYCGDTGNDGAVLVFDSNLDYKPFTYYAEDDMKEEKVKFSDKYCTLTNSVAAKLIQRIAVKRLQLIDYYDRCAASAAQAVAAGGTASAAKPEAKGSPVITRLDWALGLKKVLGLNIRFLSLQDLLDLPKKGVYGKTKGKINYAEWLSKFAPVNLLLDSKASQGGGLQEAMRKLTTVLLQHRVAVRSMFRFFDSDGNGVISPGELENGLVCLAKVYGIEFSSGEVKELCKHLDKNKDNSIDYEEFFSCFSVANPKLAKYLKDTPAYQRLRGGEINKAPVRARVFLSFLGFIFALTRAMPCFFTFVGGSALLCVVQSLRDASGLRAPGPRWRRASLLRDAVTSVAKSHPPLLARRNI